MGIPFFVKAGLASAFLFAGGSAVSAAPVYMDFQGTHTMEGDIKVTNPTRRRTSYYSGAAGGFKMHDASTGGLGSFVAWCLDLSTSVRDAKYEVFTKADPIFDNGKGAVLLNGGQKSAIQSLFDTAYMTVSANLDSKKYSGGFQLALWEIVYETGKVGYDLGTGVFQDLFGKPSSRTDAFDYANQILSGLGKDDTSSDLYSLKFLESETKTKTYWNKKKQKYITKTYHTSQNLVTGEKNPDFNPPEPVPLPATGVLMLGGIAGFAALRRRKKRS